MDMTSYPSPIDKLLTYGKPEPKDAQNWPDYLELGLGSEHIPDLLRMAADKELWEADEVTSENWAPVHAWRALGQLRAPDAVEPLLHLFEERNADDWAIEELPQVYGMIGAAAIPTIEAYVADRSHEEYAGLAQSGLEYIAKLHPEDKPEAVAALIRLLENFEVNDYEMNAFLISSLIDLKALEALPLIERAFAAGRVDESIPGDWDDVQVELGLKEPSPEKASPEPMIPFHLFERKVEPITPDMFKIIPPDEQNTPTTLATPHPGYFSAKSFNESKRSRKAKNKMVKQSRKKNKKRR